MRVCWKRMGPGDAAKTTRQQPANKGKSATMASDEKIESKTRFAAPPIGPATLSNPANLPAELCVEITHGARLYTALERCNAAGVDFQEKNCIKMLNGPDCRIFAAAVAPVALMPSMNGRDGQHFPYHGGRRGRDHRTRSVTPKLEARRAQGKRKGGGELIHECDNSIE